MSSHFVFYNSATSTSTSTNADAFLSNSNYDSSTSLLQGEGGGGHGAPTATAFLPTNHNHNHLFTTNDIQLRFLNPSDYATVKTLCEDWFPVEYPPTWFQAITSDDNFFSLAAVLRGQIIGLIVSELRAGRYLGSEDRDLLAKSQLKKYSVAYILSLGVLHSQRRNGVASLLLSSLLNHLSTLQCKAVYLHVLTSNEPAIRFYEKHHFRVHKFLPFYYSIGGRGLDGFTYVLYLNRGHGPWALHDYLNHLCHVVSHEVCSWPHWCLSQLRRVAHSLITFTR